MKYNTEQYKEFYLLFHFGNSTQVCPLLPELWKYAEFPTRVVQRACSVGRSTFELTLTFKEVVGIDSCFQFIEEAKKIQLERAVFLPHRREGITTDTLEATLPGNINWERAHFELGDACNLRENLGLFDFVLAANLIDRVIDPKKLIHSVQAMVRPGGYLVLTSPYNWSEDFTPKDKWLECPAVESLEDLLPCFVLKHTEDLPFLIRRDRRTLTVGVAEMTIWSKEQ